jgi:hypothetical protein
VTHGLCKFLDRVYVLYSCSKHEVFLANNGEQEGSEEGGIERVDGIDEIFVEYVEIVCATRVWDPGLSGIVHDYLRHRSSQPAVIAGGGGEERAERGFVVGLGSSVALPSHTRPDLNTVSDEPSSHSLAPLRKPNHYGEIDR